jgi:hypothetical protein
MYGLITPFPISDHEVFLPRELGRELSPLEKKKKKEKG